MAATESDTLDPGFRQSTRFIQLAGYIILILALLDAASIVFPPDPMNPSWEFSTFGQFVEKSLIFFLSFLMIFYQGNVTRGHGEIHLIRLVSWFALLLGVLYLLMIPLGIANTARLDTQRTAEVTEQFEAQITQLEALQERLQTVEALTPLRNLGQRLQLSESALQTEDPDALKQTLAKQLGLRIQGLERQAADQARERTVQLWERSIKWNLGALLASLFFVIAWRQSRWARQMEARHSLWHVLSSPFRGLFRLLKRLKPAPKIPKETHRGESRGGHQHRSGDGWFAYQRRRLDLGWAVMRERLSGGRRRRRRH